MKKFRSLLIKWFKVKNELVVQVNEHNKFHVIEVEKETSQVSEALGLTEARKGELVDVAINTYRSTKNVVECMAIASKECKHANELFWMSFIIADHHTNGLNPGKMLAQMLMGGNGFKPKG